MLLTITITNMLTKEHILQQAANYGNDTVALRRHLHEHPEVSFHETQTSAFVQQKLTEYGIPFKTGYAQNGIAAFIQTDKPGKTIVLRADMDALPIEEDASHQCVSANVGTMHACGHDLHVASLLTAARILNDARHLLTGTIMLVFQPGEESFPGGANVMMKEGLFNNISPDVVIGAHVMPDMPVGHVGFCAGTYMASGDEIHITVNGKGGHGGMPHLLTDNVLVACQIVVDMQHLVARVVPATVPAVLSFGKIIANGATNIIPDSVYIAGTLRMMSEEWRATMKQRIRKVANGIAESFGTTCNIDIKDGYPSVYNNPEITAQAEQFATELLGPQNVEQMSVRMTAEDFGYYTQLYPSVFYRFGVARPDGTTGNVHTSHFLPSEDALITSPAVMAWLAVRFLQQE